MGFQYVVVFADVKGAPGSDDDWLRSFGLTPTPCGSKYFWGYDEFAEEWLHVQRCAEPCSDEIVQWYGEALEVWFDFGVLRIGSVEHAILEFSYRQVDSWNEFLAARATSLRGFIAALAGRMSAQAVVGTHDIDGIPLAEIDERVRSPGAAPTFGFNLVGGTLLASMRDLDGYELESLHGMQFAYRWPFDGAGR